MPFTSRSRLLALVLRTTPPQGSCWRPDRGGSHLVGCGPLCSMRPTGEEPRVMVTPAPSVRCRRRNQSQSPLLPAPHPNPTTPNPMSPCGCGPAQSSRELSHGPLASSVTHTEDNHSGCHHRFRQSPCPAFSPCLPPLGSSSPWSVLLWAPGQPQPWKHMTPLCSVLIK